MSNILIQMLGKFDIVVDGNSILHSLGHSPKSLLLLKYLILNQNKPIPISKLIDIFWPESDKSANPENALKTMVSRLRTNLANAAPELKNCIVPDSYAYVWSPEAFCEVDAFLFEKLCKELQGSDVIDESNRDKYLRVLDIYAGDLSHANAGEDWIVSRSMYLHHLYLKVVYRFIEHLKSENDYGMALHVCRLALDVDPFDEALNLELMNALKECGQRGAALQQYRYVASVFQKYLGIKPSENLVRFYKELLENDATAETDIDTILRSLNSENGGKVDSDALLCDYSVLKDVYNLQMRNIKRQQNKMFLCLLSVSHMMDEPLDAMLLENVMKELLEILKSCLRRGDTVSRYSSSQYAILLPMMNQSNGQIVMNRVKTMFYKQYADKMITLTFQFEGVNQN